ncbi:hypothetical protein ACM1RC_30315 [Paenibacillus azoreducens]|uniref:hypothetical protein n=1 Tax=Paenibacillus azoreducens TaxID=116718 RepID=UPI0039F5E98F
MIREVKYHYDSLYSGDGRQIEQKLIGIGVRASFSFGGSEVVMDMILLPKEIIYKGNIPDFEESATVLLKKFFLACAKEVENHDR